MSEPAIPQHMVNHTRNESHDSDGVSRFSEDSDNESNELRNGPPRSKRSSRSSTALTATMNNNSPSKKKRLCSFNLSKFKESLRSLLWWKKKDKNKETVLPLAITVEMKEKRRKRRTCCLIILLVIIILLLLGNLIALDAIYLRSPILQTNNVTTLLNDGNSSNPNSPNASNPAQPNFKSISCANMLSLPPKIFPCDFCLDDQSFYNVTTFCALKILWFNAVNQTALETNQRWMQTSNVCDWIGVTCDKSNNIIFLELVFPNTVKTLDFSLARLTTLQRLTISGDGQIPNDIIPSGIFRLPNLIDISLTSTGLSTSFSGSLPNTFDKMISLKSIQFRNNRFLNGSLPETISQTSLTTLIYSAQNIGGPFPDFIGNSKTLQTSLQTLDLSQNQFTGTIDSLLNLNNLKSLILRGNFLTGEPLPSLITTKFAKSIFTLDLSSNGFSGTIPPSINQFTNLFVLNLQSNTFTGQIPPEVTSLANLDALMLTSNNLTGSIPGGIGNMNKLTKLLLSDNALTGAIPPIICKTYVRCSLARNQFTFPPGPFTCGTCDLA